RSRTLTVRWVTFVVAIMGSPGFGLGASGRQLTASGPGGHRAEEVSGRPTPWLADHEGGTTGSRFLGGSIPSIDKGPAPPRISASRPAIYRRLTSYPGGPNCGPSAVNPMVLTALKPYRRWTVNIATSIMTISGTLTTATNAPARIAKPPRISRSVDTQAVNSGSGAPI